MVIVNINIIINLIQMKPLKPNQAAALAVSLVRRRAKICEPHASKVPRRTSPTLQFQSFSNNEESEDALVGLFPLMNLVFMFV